MAKILIYICYAIVGSTLGVVGAPYLWHAIFGNDVSPFLDNSIVNTIIGLIVFVVLFSWAIKHIERGLRTIESFLAKTSNTSVLFGSLGLIVGLIISFLLSLPIGQIEVPIISNVLPILLAIFFGYLGVRMGITRKEEWINIITLKNTGKKKQAEAVVKEKEIKEKPKFLDTSVVIDGRIADIIRTGFLEGPIMIPLFVLEELQHIADSSDSLKRTKGRRGLDILNALQNEKQVEVKMFEGDYEDITEVDSKLVRAAKEFEGIVVTNDYNLNKVCEFQKIPVLNINDLANAVKPVVLPGEKLNLLVVKDGKERNQGIGYLDDGTMIVVEEGRRYINQNIDVVVTSVLQTSAGRMIFAKAHK